MNEFIQHLKNLKDKQHTHVSVDIDWLLSILEKSTTKHKPPHPTPKVELDGGKF